MDALKDTLSLVNDWLKFAEAKNAVVVTATGVALWATIRLIMAEETGCQVDLYLSILVIFLLSSFITSLLSFLPVLNYRWIIPEPAEIANKNLLYFGYLSTLSNSQLIKKYREVTHTKETEVSELDDMYAEQIIINSRIALAKYEMFERAVKILLYGVLTPFIAFPLLYITKIKRGKIDDNG